MLHCVSCHGSHRSHTVWRLTGVAVLGGTDLQRALHVPEIAAALAGARLPGCDTAIVC